MAGEDATALQQLVTVAGEDATALQQLVTVAGEDDYELSHGRDQLGVDSDGQLDQSEAGGEDQLSDVSRVDLRELASVNDTCASDAVGPAGAQENLASARGDIVKNCWMKLYVNKADKEGQPGKVSQLTETGQLCEQSQLSEAGQLCDESQLSEAGQLCEESQLSEAGQLCEENQLSEAGQLCEETQQSCQVIKESQIVSQVASQVVSQLIVGSQLVEGNQQAELCVGIQTVGQAGKPVVKTFHSEDRECSEMGEVSHETVSDTEINNNVNQNDNYEKKLQKSKEYVLNKYSLSLEVSSSGYSTGAVGGPRAPERGNTTENKGPTMLVTKASVMQRPTSSVRKSVKKTYKELLIVKLPKCTVKTSKESMSVKTAAEKAAEKLI